ncbi:MAG: nuclear transport factor 2 family protein [Sphingomonadaceae bacterium]
MDDTARIDKLEKRVRQMESLNEIHNLKYLYFDIIDHFRSGMIGEVFAEEGVASLTTMGEYKGRKEITDFFDNSFFPSMEMVLHMGHHPQISLLSDTSARGTWLYEVYIITKGPKSDGIWLTGLYKDEYVLENGRWLIKYLSGGYYFNTTSDMPWARERFSPYPPGTPPLPEQFRITK